MVPKVTRDEMLVRANNKSTILIILNMIVSTPQGDNATLKVVGVDDSNGMEIDGKFDCRCRIRYASIQQNRVPKIS
jgi:hypothetical protein